MLSIRSRKAIHEAILHERNRQMFVEFVIQHIKTLDDPMVFLRKQMLYRAARNAAKKVGKCECFCEFYFDEVCYECSWM